MSNKVKMSQYSARMGTLIFVWDCTTTSNLQLRDCEWFVQMLELWGRQGDGYAEQPHLRDRLQPIDLLKGLVSRITSHTLLLVIKIYNR